MWCNYSKSYKFGFVKQTFNDYDDYDGICCYKFLIFYILDSEMRVERWCLPSCPTTRFRPCHRGETWLWRQKQNVGRTELICRPPLWRRGHDTHWGLHSIKNTKPEMQQLWEPPRPTHTHAKASPWKQPSPKSALLLADSLTSQWCLSAPQPDCSTSFTTSWPGCRPFPYILLLLPRLHPQDSEARVQRRVCADIMRRWRQMAVSQPANEELIASFLRGCDLLVQGEGGGGGVWCWVEVDGAAEGWLWWHKEAPNEVIKCKRWWRLLWPSVSKGVVEKMKWWCFSACVSNKLQIIQIIYREL